MKCFWSKLNSTTSFFSSSDYRVSKGLTTLTNCMNATKSERFWLLFMKAAKTAQQFCENKRESPFCVKPKDLLQLVKFTDFLKNSSVSFDPLRKTQEQLYKDFSVVVTRNVKYPLCLRSSFAFIQHCICNIEIISKAEYPEQQ